MFAYDYTTDTVHTPAILHGTNPTGITVNTTASTGGTGIVFAKTGGTGDWMCGTVQGGACQFQIAGDPTTYTFQWYQTDGDDQWCRTLNAYSLIRKWSGEWNTN